MVASKENLGFKEYLNIFVAKKSLKSLQIKKFFFEQETKKNFYLTDPDVIEENNIDSKQQKIKSKTFLQGKFFKMS